MSTAAMRSRGALGTRRVLTRDGTAGVDDAFLDLAPQVYAGDRAWIPEEPDAVARAFSPANPWFGGGGRAATFCVPGRARLAVFRPPACRVRGRPAAFFGYWEHRGAPDASHALFEKAAAWARAEGAAVLYGPADFGTFGRYRLRTAAEPGALPFPGEPYNPAAYAGVLEGAGFAVAERYVTQVGAVSWAALGAARLALAGLRASGYRVEPLDGARWLALLPTVHAAADAIFGANPGYTPLAYPAFTAAVGAPVARRLCPHTSVVAFAPDGALAGFVVAQPHWGPVVTRGAPGGPVPLGALDFAEHAGRLAAAEARRGLPRTAVARTVGVAPAHRRRGLLTAMGAAVLGRARGRYDRWLGALIRADNPSRRFGAAHARAERGYALYARALDGGPLADDAAAPGRAA